MTGATSPEKQMKNLARTSGMGRKEFQEFRSLYLSHRHFFDFRTSPEPETLRAFNDLLRKSPYVEGMFHSGALKGTISALEKGFQKQLKKFNSTLIPVPLSDGSLPPDEEPSEEMKQATKLEREVRFIIKCAFLSQHHFEEKYIFFKTRQDKHRSQAIKFLEAASRELKWLTPDPFLAKGYLSPEAQPKIEHLGELLPAVIKHLETAFPQYPVQRISRGAGKSKGGEQESEKQLTNALSRQLLDRLFDACSRHYAYYPPEAINLLLSCNWLGRGTQYVVTWKDVTAFKKRRKNVDQERDNKIDPIPYENVQFVDPWKDWEPILSPLGGAEPGFEYDAPWLRW